MAVQNRVSIRKLLNSITKNSPGSIPGSLMETHGAQKTALNLIRYSEEKFDEREVDDLGNLRALTGAGDVTWLDTVGIGDLDVLREVAAQFGIHELALADVVNTIQRPKVEEYPENWYLVIHMPPVRPGEAPEQLSVFIGEGYVLTFQERPGDCLEPVRRRIRQAEGRIRRMGADYLAYAILDAVVDRYFPVLDELGDRMEGFEDQILLHANRATVSLIQDLKHELLSMRRVVRPLREAIGSLMKDSGELIGEETSLFLRDCYDHSIQAIELVESYREVASGLMDLYLSSMGQRTNEIMKVLTIIATLFIPLGFIAGFYGMEFNVDKSSWLMSELSWIFSYPFALGLMMLTAIGLLLYFRRKGWVGKRR